MLLFAPSGQGGSKIGKVPFALQVFFHFPFKRPPKRFPFVYMVFVGRGVVALNTRRSFGR